MSYKFEGKYLTATGRRLFEFDGKYIKKYAGATLYEFNGSYIRKYAGPRLYELTGRDIRKYAGPRICSYKDLQDAIITILKLENLL